MLLPTIRRLFTAILLLGLVVPASSFAVEAYSTGRGPVAMVSGDFNGDGKIDFAVANKLSGTVSVFLNRGDGHYLAATTYSVGRTPVAIAAGDLRGSGKLDLVIANRDSGEIVVMRGLGNGKFSGPESVAAIDRPSDLSLADLTHTGKLSIAVANEAGKLTVFHSEGSKFVSAGEYAIGSAAFHVAAADLRGQGLLDLVATDAQAKSVSVLRNRGDGTFEAPRVQAVSAEPTRPFEFVNSRGASDAVIGRNGLDPVWVKGGDASSAVRNVISSATSKAGNDLMAVPDLAHNTIAIVGRNASGALATISRVPFHAPSAAQFADLDGSGHKLLVATSYSDSSFTVVGNATTTTLLSSVNPSVYGQSVTFTITVAPTIGTGTPTGNVTLYNGATPFGTRLLSGGSATISLSDLAPNTYNLTAQYGGDATFSGSTSSAVNQVVNPANSTTTLVADNNNTNFGANINFTATVTTNSPGVDAPNGIVDFNALNNGVPSYIGTRSLDNTGKATIAFPALSGGTNTVTATYHGSPRLAGSTSNTLTQTVNKVASTSSVTANINPVGTGTSVTLTATVTAAPPAINYENPQGSVSFYDGNTLLAAVPITRGVVQTSYNTTFSTVGFHYIVVKYPGDGNYLPSDNTASEYALAVTSTTTTAVLSSANPSAYNQGVTFTVNVTSGGGTPNGQVTLFDGATSLGTRSLTAGSATFSISNLAVATHSITAQYAGSSQFGPSTSSTLTQTVNAANTSTSLGTNFPAPNGTFYGNGITFTAVVSSIAPGAGTPSGNVTFTANGGTITLGTRTVDNTGSASITFSSLPAGVNTVNVSYAGSANYNSSTNSLSQPVGLTTTSMTSGTQTGTYGVTPITVSASVTPVVGGGPAVGGTITFFIDGTPFASRSVVAGGASFTSTTIPKGSHVFTATYNGSTENATSTSGNSTSVTIN